MIKNDITRKMLGSIRNLQEGVLIKESSEGSKKSFQITKSTPQFGDVRASQEEALTKTIGEQIEMGDNGLIYTYSDGDSSDENITLTAKINSINLVFQFKFNDSLGEGCYIWANGLQLGKIRDAFKNWRDSLLGDSSLFTQLRNAVKRN